MNVPDNGIVDASAKVEVVYLLLKPKRMFMVILRTAAELSHGLVIAPDKEEIVNPEEIEIKERILRFLLRETLAYYMRHGSDTVTVLERTGNCNRTRTLHHTDTLVCSATA